MIKKKIKKNTYKNRWSISISVFFPEFNFAEKCFSASLLDFTTICIYYLNFMLWEFIYYKKEIGIIIMIKLEIRKIQSRKTMLSPLWESTKNWEIMFDFLCLLCFLLQLNALSSTFVTVFLLLFVDHASQQTQCRFATSYHSCRLYFVVRVTLLF